MHLDVILWMYKEKPLDAYWLLIITWLDKEKGENLNIITAGNLRVLCIVIISQLWVLLNSFSFLGQN